MTMSANGGDPGRSGRGPGPGPAGRPEIGRTFLLTGVTGFLGKVVLEELLRRREELALERAYVLIRARGQVPAAERFGREVAGAACFSRLPAGWTRYVDVVEGDLARPGLDLTPAIRDELTGRVTHVLHTAGSINFDLPLGRATQANVTTSLNLLELAQACARLERLVCVSTAYATPHPGDGVPVEESLAPLPAPAAELYHSILSGTVQETELLTRSGHPNTYTLTKSLAEHLLMARCGHVPLTIVRPSIISASWRHPFPGWIDSAAAFGAFVTLLGLGHLRAVVAHPDARLDLIPVDEVAGRVLGSCRADGNGTAPVIRHAVAGFDRSPRIRDCWEVIRDFFRIHRVARRPMLAYLGPPGVWFRLAHAVHHGLGIALVGLRSRSLRRLAGQLRTKLAYVNRAFPYFTSQSFNFRASQPLGDGFEPRSYVRTVCRGVYRHLLGGDDTEWVLAGRRHPGHGGDLRWVMGQPHGNGWIRFASWIVTKVLRHCVDRVTVDIPSFEAARRAAPHGSPLVIVPNHRSYLDFVLCSYLAFARPDLRIPIPHIAATIEFGRIPLLGRILRALHAFYLRRGLGREDPDLTRRVHAFIHEGRTLEFFIEGQRSRSREFLSPKRGLLRCMQGSGAVCTILPVALSYDRVPEEKVFARELAGAPKPKMRLAPLLRWTWRAWRGRIDLGRIHMACGTAIRLAPESDVHAVSQAVIESLKRATVATTYHLRAFLECHPIDGIDPAWLRGAIEERGGRVLESSLRPPPDLDPLIARTLRHQFAHLFETDDASDGERLRRLRHALFATAGSGIRPREPVG